jgi:hypothetical protein
MAKRSKTHRLYVIPSFFLGIGSILNLFGSYYDYYAADSVDQANAEAIKSDWEMVGQDMTFAVGRTPNFSTKDDQ